MRKPGARSRHGRDLCRPRGRFHLDRRWIRGWGPNAHSRRKHSWPGAKVYEEELELQTLSSTRSNTEMPTSQIKSRLCFSLTLVLLISACKFYKGPSGRSAMLEGTAIADAAAAFKKKIGGPFKALNVQINPDSVTLRAQDPKQPANVDEYHYSAFVRSVSGPRPVQLSSLEINLDKTLFDFDSVNWAATESLARAAIERNKIDGGKIEKMTVERGLAIGSTVTNSGSLKWTIEVN